MKKVEGFTIVVCGAGALGANLVENLCRQGFKSVTVLDRDRIEPHNVNTQPYGIREVGQSKVAVLSGNMFRSLKVPVQAVYEELTGKNIDKNLGGAQLVVDAFDNSKSRKLVQQWCLQKEISCLHAGMSDDGFGEVVWNEIYTVPADSGQDICDYPLARNLALFVSTIACECIIKYISAGEKESYAFTLGDMKISKR
jgi:predicted dinucleotide-binding enzyme